LAAGGGGVASTFGSARAGCGERGNGHDTHKNRDEREGQLDCGTAMRFFCLLNRLAFSVDRSNKTKTTIKVSEK